MLGPLSFALCLTMMSRPSGWNRDLFKNSDLGYIPAVKVWTARKIIEQGNDSYVADTPGSFLAVTATI